MKNLVERSIKIVSSWKRKITNKQYKNKKQEKRIPWVTQFYNIIKMGKLENKLAPTLASITYCRPPTLGNSLLNYRKIAHTSDQEQSNQTKKCGKCGLCGNFTV